MWDTIRDIITFLGTNPTAATLSLVGLVLLGLAGLLIYLTSGATISQRILVFCALIAGILFSVAGPAVGIFATSPHTAGKMTSQVAFDRLQRNQEARWLIRFISYENDSTSGKELAINKLERLGPKDQLFSFVADYEELAGYTVKQATEMTGNIHSKNQRTSVILFPLRTRLWPANPLGILQLIQEVDKRRGVDVEKSFFAGENSKAAGKHEDTHLSNQGLSG
jgi:hypothetical protein